jgi:putative flippase GtrA
MGRIIRLRALRQFIKFCLVGATSTAIQLGIFRILVGLGEPAWVHQIALPHWLTPTIFYILVANCMAFCLAVTNGFIWNRIWTFKGQHSRDARTQYLLFVLVNIVGLIISSAILFVMVRLLHGGMGYSRISAGMIGQLVALPAVAVWNFTANKYWTFAAHPASD